MGLFDFLSKGRTPEKPVLPLPMVCYFRDHDLDEGRLFIHFDETFTDPSQRSPWTVCFRAVVAAQRGSLDGGGNADAVGLSELKQVEAGMIDALEKANADCRLVGTRRLGEEMALFLMSNGDRKTHAALNSWKGKISQVVSIEELDSGWNSYTQELLPDTLGWRQIRDQKAIARLFDSGSKMDKKHWTEHRVKGDEMVLDLFKQEMEFQGFYVMVEKEGVLILERHLMPELNAIHEVTSMIQKKAEAYDADYLGWDAPAMKEGSLQGDCTNGFGVFAWANGSVYEGDWKNSKRTGKGRMKFNDGSYHVGDFVENKRTGYGELHWSQDEYYTGDFLDGEMHGTGTYVWPSGNKYTGAWVKGERVGQGEFWWASGDRYEGAFLNSTRTGVGRYWWTNGDWWVGGFKEGKLHGIGTEYVAKKHSICERIYEMGKMIQELSARPAEPHEVAGPPDAVPPPIPRKEDPVPTLEELSWTVLDCPVKDFKTILARETETAAWANKNTFLFTNATWAPPEFDLKQYANHPEVARALGKVHVVVADERYKTELHELGFTSEIVPTLYAVNQDGTKGDREMIGAIAGWNPENMGVVLERFFSGEKLKSAMDYELPPTASKKHTWVTIENHDGRSLREIIDEEKGKAVGAGMRLYLFVHEAWSPGSVAFWNARKNPALTSIMEGIYMVELPSKWLEDINDMGLDAWMVPEFFKVSTISGRLTGRRINGGAWGEDTLENIVDVMGEFFLNDHED